MKYVPDAVSRKIATTTLKGRQQSPAILFAVGVVGIGATVVTACRATLKLEEVLDEAQLTLGEAKSLAHGNSTKVRPGSKYDYSEDDLKKDQAIIYVQTVVKIGRLYAPSIALGVVSIACLTQSHRILSRRNAALTAAYTILEKGFNDYRGRVVAEYGEEKDREFLHGVHEETILEKTEKGMQETTVKKLNGAAIYGRVFDHTNDNWQPTPSVNETFLRAQQEWANNRLRAKGYVFLNDIYESLGFERTQAGQVVGWVWGRDSQGTGDGYIDFGIGDWPTAEDWAYGREKSVILNFNVDGPINNKPVLAKY